MHTCFDVARLIPFLRVLISFASTVHLFVLPHIYLWNDLCSLHLLLEMICEKKNIFNKINIPIDRVVGQHVQVIKWPRVSAWGPAVRLYPTLSSWSGGSPHSWWWEDGPPPAACHTVGVREMETQRIIDPSAAETCSPLAWRQSPAPWPHAHLQSDHVGRTLHVSNAGRQDGQARLVKVVESFLQQSQHNGTVWVNQDITSGKNKIHFKGKTLTIRYGLATIWIS